MKKQTLSFVRNLGIMAHVDAGKTTVAEQILFNTGRIHRAGKVHEGDTVLDSGAEEAARGITISSAATTVPWMWRDDAYRLNLIDTPGHVDFTLEVERALRVLDGAIAVFDAVAGVEPQSETVWHQADRHNVPRLAFINKMDRPGATEMHAVETMRERLGARAVPIQWPWGCEAAFGGVVDLVHLELDVQEGKVRRRLPIPDDLLEEAMQAREAMIEALAEVDEDVLALWIDGQPLDAELLLTALRRATVSGQIVPVLYGAALHNHGVMALLDAVVALLPSPLDIEPVQGEHPSTGETDARPPEDDAPLAALVFKVVSDDYAGQLSYVRVYSGVLSAGSRVLNSTRGQREQVSRLFRMHAERREVVEEARAGDIVALVGLKKSITGDTLSDAQAPVVLASIDVPEPVVWTSLEVEESSDLTRLSAALRRLSLEDPSFQVRSDAETGQNLVGGMGELHLEIMGQKLAREHKLKVSMGRPQVALRETITRTVEHRERLKKMTGGPGLFAEVVLRVEPGEPGSGVVFEDLSHGGSVPKQFVGAVEQGVRNGAERGPLGGHPLQDLKVSLIDGAYHAVDSKDLAFMLCASQALQAAASEAGPVLLEPLMRVEIVSPSDHLGAVLGEVNVRRGQVEAVEERGVNQWVQASMPLAELFGFTGALRGLSQGRASASMLLDRYAAVPSRVQASLLTQGNA